MKILLTANQGPKKYAHQELRDSWELWKRNHPDQKRREESSEPEVSTASQSITSNCSEDHESVYRVDTPKKQTLILHLNQNRPSKVEESPQSSTAERRSRSCLKPQKPKQKGRKSAGNSVVDTGSQDQNALHGVNPENTQRIIPDSQALQQGTDLAPTVSSYLHSWDSLESSELSTGYGGDTEKFSGYSSQTSEDHLRSLTESQSQRLSNRQGSQTQSQSLVSGQTKSNTQASASFGDLYSQSQASFKPLTGEPHQSLTEGESRAFDSSANPSNQKPVSVNPSPIDQNQAANYRLRSSFIPASSLAHPDSCSDLSDSQSANKSTLEQKNSGSFAQSQPALSCNNRDSQVSEGSTVSSGTSTTGLPAGGISENSQIVNVRDTLEPRESKQEQPSICTSPKFARTPNFRPANAERPKRSPASLTTGSSSESSHAAQIRSRVASLSKEAGIVNRKRKMEPDNAEISGQNGPTQEERLSSEVFAEHWANNMVTKHVGGAKRPKFDPVTRRLVYPDETPSGQSGSTESHLPPDETQRPATQNTQLSSTVSSLPLGETQQNRAQETQPSSADLATQNSPHRDLASSNDYATHVSGRDVEALKHPARIDVPLPLLNPAHAIYNGWFESRKKVVEACIESIGESTVSQHDMKEFIGNLNDIAFHQDLVIDETGTQGPAPSKAEAEWAIQTSSKFKFLADLLDATRDADKHVVLFVKSGRPMNITAKFLKGRRIAYRRPDLGENMRKHSRLHVTVLGTDQGSSQIIADRADLIIGLDDSFDAQHSLVHQMKGDALQTGKTCPVLSLVVVNTPEHMERAVTSSETDLGRSKKLIALSKAHLDLVKTPKPPIDVASLAARVSEHLLGANGADLKLPSLNVYRINHRHNRKAEPSQPTRLQKGKGKRTASESSPASDTASKKPRLSNDLVQPNPSASLSRIANSSITKTSPKQDSWAGSSQQDEAQKKLQHWIRVAENREETVATLQPQVEQLSLENMSLKAQVAELDRYKAENEAKDEDIAERDQTIHLLKQDLAKEQKRLADSTIPEHQELEAAREKARKLDVLEKKIASQAQELEYVREQYQNASSRATEYSEEIQELSKEAERLRVQASGEARRLKEAAQKTTDRSLHSEVERLGAMLKSREQLLQKTGEDNERLKKENQSLNDRVGMTTRAAARSNSVPTSGEGPPRRGTPNPAQSSLLSPGGPAMRQVMATISADAQAATTGISRPGSRRASQAASRTGSPAPGKLPPKGSFSTKVVKGAKKG